VDYGKFLNIIQSNLAARECRIKNSVFLGNRVSADLIAERWYIAKGLHLVFQITFVVKYNSPQLQDLIAIREAELAYIRKMHRFFFLRGLQLTYCVINCVVADGSTIGLPKIVTNRPMSQRGLIELPVLFESRWVQAHYFKGKTSVSALADAQHLIADCIEGAQPKAATTLVSKPVRAY
jgi:hypothetical protein